MDDLNQQTLSSKFTGELIYSIIQKQNVDLQYSVFSFITDHKNTIEVIFTKDEANYISRLPTASITIKSNEEVLAKKFYDKQVRNSICHIIYSYMAFNPNVVYYYVTDIHDNRQKARDRLFKSYFKLSCKEENLKMRCLNIEDVYMGMLYSTFSFSENEVELEISKLEK